MDNFSMIIGYLIICSLGLLSLTKGQKVNIVPPETNVKKFVNDSYFISCQPPQAIWTNPKGGRVPDNINGRIRVENGFGVELFFQRITTQDSGIYTCSHKNSRASFNLTVIRPIVFDRNYEEQSAVEGKNYLMRCMAQGQNLLKISWKVDQSNVPAHGKFKVMKDGLHIHNVTAQDGNKTYVCRAMDIDSPLPSFQQMSIVLKVKMKPRVVSTPDSPVQSQYWGVMNEWANLTCNVMAEPPARFEWIHRNRTLQRSDEVFIINEPPNLSILQVLIRSESKFGAYTCKASNELGTIERVLYLQRAKKPLVPVLESDLIGKDAAKIRVKSFAYNKPTSSTKQQQEQEKKMGKDLPITGYVVQYKMETRGEWITANVSRYDGGFILTGLSPTITYNVRAALKNEASVGDFSKSIRIVTPKESSFHIGRASNQFSSHQHLFSILAIISSVLFSEIFVMLL